MATTNSSPEVTLVVCPARAGRHVPLRLPLRVHDSDEGLVQMVGASVADDIDYTFRLECKDSLPPCRATLTVNGELVAFGETDARVDDVTGLALRRVGVRPPFSLFFGLARAELYLVGDDLECRLASDGVTVLVHGDGANERERVDAMLEALMTPGDTALAWMYASDAHESPQRFSIIEGSLLHGTTVDLTSFLRLTEEVLAGFEETLPSFRQRVARRVSTTPVRMPRSRVTRLTAAEALWIARNPSSLEQVAHASPITDGTRSFLPRHIEAGKRCESLDLYENRCITSFLQHLTHRLGRLEHLLRTRRESRHARNGEPIAPPDGYYAPETLVGAAIHAREDRRRLHIRQLAARAHRLAGSYGRMLTGTETHGAFRPPRQTKLFLESAPYLELFTLMRRWCDQGSVSLAPGEASLHVHRLDTLFERYALHEILQALMACGFDADPSEEAPFAHVDTYAPGAHSSTADVCNRYLLARGDTRVQLFVEPAIAASDDLDESDEGALPLRRTTRTASGRDTPFVPDFCLRTRTGDGAWRYVVLDAKYRHVAGVMRRADRTIALPGGNVAQLTEMQAAIMKYRLSIVARDTGLPPRAVWLLCGRDDTAMLDRFEDSAFSRANPDIVAASGACSLSPSANVLDELFVLLGIAQPRDG